MSTYLAAWVILPKDFAYIEATSEKGKPVRIIKLPKPIYMFASAQFISHWLKIRVYARKNAVAAKQADFALDIAKNSLDYFENVYFEISEAVPPKIGK